MADYVTTGCSFYLQMIRHSLLLCVWAGSITALRLSGDENRVRKTSLKVAEANSKDVGKRIARVDPKVSEELDLLTGDVVEISSEKAKVSVLTWSSYQQDYGNGNASTHKTAKLKKKLFKSWYIKMWKYFG